ncbi:hypothetical protein Rleg4DRAFT_1414 [Rhizobium leguminosarum bv. trifolii WSM2297]|uniref:Uncharacterized protein n=1 Tax=Rhizobium leguminosarum bv. trifolii WSM2297 TaxID=754762 RepID=J0C9S5_RHILT|nr:hypothetical protein Rleg4DRAFT_1414 [Rhizobium leguminosarum bv. trifolii WSM2297]
MDLLEAANTGHIERPYYQGGGWQAREPARVREGADVGTHQ